MYLMDLHMTQLLQGRPDIASYWRSALLENMGWFLFCALGSYFIVDCHLQVSESRALSILECIMLISLVWLPNPCQPALTADEQSCVSNGRAHVHV
jgi:hypothetical protein